MIGRRREKEKGVPESGRNWAGVVSLASARDTRKTQAKGEANSLRFNEDEDLDHINDKD